MASRAKSGGLATVDPPPRRPAPGGFTAERVQAIAEQLPGGHWLTDGQGRPTRSAAYYRAEALIGQLETLGHFERWKLERRAWSEDDGWHWAIRLRKESG